MNVYLFILNNYYAFCLKDIFDGISHRYVMLYGSLSRYILQHSQCSRVYWYSSTDKTLRIIHQNKIKALKEFMIGILKDIFHEARKRSQIIVFVIYPHVLSTGSKSRVGIYIELIISISQYILLMIILRLLKIGGLVTVVVDYFDPPIELEYASTGKVKLRNLIFYRVMDMFSMRLAIYILTTNDFLKKHIENIYKIKDRRIFVFPNGTLSKIIQYKPPRTEGKLVVLYSGAVHDSRGINMLISTISSLREKNLHIELRLTGRGSTNLPSWVYRSRTDWLTFVTETLPNADVFVIPYPPGFKYIMPAKIWDYMAAGKPIILTNLPAVSTTIRLFNCGFVARSQDEVSFYLEELYKDRELPLRNTLIQNY